MNLIWCSPQFHGEVPRSAVFYRVAKGFLQYSEKAKDMFRCGLFRERREWLHKGLTGSLWFNRIRQARLNRRDLLPIGLLSNNAFGGRDLCLIEMHLDS